MVMLARKPPSFIKGIRRRPKRFIEGKLIAVDTETTGLDAWHGDQPFCFGFCNPLGEIVTFHWEVDPWTRVVLPNEEELEQVQEFMEDPGIEKIFHNAKYDVRIMELGFGIKTRGRINDTMFMAHICNTLEMSFGLKELSEKYLDYPRDDQKDLKRAVLRCRNLGRKLGWTLAYKEKVGVDGTIKLEAMVEADYWMPKLMDPSNGLCEHYCGSDVERTMLLHSLYTEGLTDLGLWEVYERELELWPVTYDMETAGVRIDPVKVDGEIVRFREEAAKWKAVVDKAAWKGFNLESTPQLRKLVYEKLKLPVKKQTEKGNPQCDINALSEHLGNPTIDALFRYRACKNGLVNFFEKYHKLKVREAGDVWALHPNFQQMGPVTGRFSCREPNLQNVANALTTRSPMPIQARTPFGPRPGYIWYSIDYSQLEVRIFADVAQEMVMLQAIADGEDMHTACTNKAWGGKGNPAAIRTAIHALELDGSSDGKSELIREVWKVFGVRELRSLSQNNKAEIAEQWLREYAYDIVNAEKSLDKKTSRAKAKMVLFAKIFGGGPGAIKDLLYVTLAEAKQFMDDYDEAFPQIVQFIHDLSIQAIKDGCIINRFGRRIAVDSRKAYRAVNYLVQGSAADLLKTAMIKTAAYLKETGLDARIVLSIHDEIMFEFKREHAHRRVLREICRIMEDHGGAFGVPTPVEIAKVTETWNSKAHAEIGKW